MAKAGSGWHRRRNDSPAAKARRARYDSAEYRAARKAGVALVATGTARCWSCGRRLVPGAWHLGHDDSGTVIKGPQCERCNLKTAARKGARVANAKRKAARFVRAVR